MKTTKENSAATQAVATGDLFGSFDVVAFVDAARKETAETRQGAVTMWGLETATGMFVGQKLMMEAHQRLLKPNVSGDPRPLGAVGSGRLFDGPASDSRK